MAVIGGMLMLMDEYLVAVVEIGVHLDDLAVSIGIDAAELDDEGLLRGLGCPSANARVEADLAATRALART